MMTTGIMIDNTKKEDFDYIKEHKFFNVTKIKKSFDNGNITSHPDQKKYLEIFRE